MERTSGIIGRANAMPASTWHSLRMNDTKIEIPPNLAAARAHVRVVGDALDAEQAQGALATAVQGMRTRWEAAHPAPSAEERAARAAVLAAEADATYGGTAQSAYQVQADALEEQRSLAISPEGGMGEEADAFLASVAGEAVVVASRPRGAVDAQVVVSARAGCASVAAVDVVAARDSTIRLSIAVDSAEGGHGEPAGVAGTRVRVVADRGAVVEIVRTQTLDDAFVDLDDMALLLDERARVTVRQTVLGGSAAYAGLAGDLRGDSAQANVNTRYLGRGSQVYDFNYVLRHHGTRTTCNLDANGVLSGRSRKTLRGTIDLIRGCKGAQGSETETVLLVDEAVRNKTIPVILCNEDDVAGNHGATIGHVGQEQLFYLASRGLSSQAAEEMFAMAMVEQAALEAPDKASRRGVVRIGERIAPGFTDLIDVADE